MSTDATTTNTAVVWPTLTYAEPMAAIRFLVDVLGFEERAVYPGETESTVAHAELRWPGGGGVMLGSHVEGSVIADLPAGTGSIYIVTDDIDARFARARDAGATVVREPRDEDYGGRDFIVRDPEGVYWTLGTYPGV